MPRTYYNCHTHIYDLKCAPDRFVKNVLLLNRFAGNKIGIALSKFISKLLPDRGRSAFARYTNMIAIGRHKNQGDIFKLMDDDYDDWFNVKFVVLAMDMGQMGAGEPIKNLNQQLDELIELKKKYPDRLLPFIAIDPRRFVSENHLLTFFQEYWETGAFNGIKLYPATGYYPDHPYLLPLYDYAIKKSIPITSHCTKGPTHYQGKLPDESLKHPLLIELGLFNESTDPSEFQCNFTQPVIFENLLKQERFKNLKLCMAHYGGASQIKAFRNNMTNPDDNWYNVIRRLIASYPNVYADISYTLSFSDVFDRLKEDIQDPALGKKILFGTDFYVVAIEETELQVKSKFRYFLDSRLLFDQIAYENPRLFLTTDFFQAP